MTHQGGTVMGTVRCTELVLRLPLCGRAWLSPPLQRTTDSFEKLSAFHFQFSTFPQIRIS